MSSLKTFWKIYSSFLTAITGFSLFLSAFTSNILWIEYAPRIILMVLSVFGLIGFSWKKEIGKQWIWKIIFFLLCVFIGVAILTSNSGAHWTFCSSSWCSVLYHFIGILIISPLVFALFQYAFRCKDIWEKR